MHGAHAGVASGNPDPPATGFYPQYLRSDLISAFREYFHEIETKRAGEIAYDSFARWIDPPSLIITLNYDVALERSLAKAGKWDIGTGYGFTALTGREASPTTVYKLHGSVNWFQAPMQDQPPPVLFTRDLKLLGYDNLSDPRLGPNGMGVNNSGTFVLPDPRKQFYWERFWQPLWGAAADACAKRRRFSFTDTACPPRTRKRASYCSAISTATPSSTSIAAARATGWSASFARTALRR